MPSSAISETLQHLRSTLLTDVADLTDGQLMERLVSGRDPAAIDALVRRYSAMVWGICRRVLNNHQDAEDAFQATFLVLVRKGASMRSPNRVGNWLFGVARQTALKARQVMAKRRAREKQVTEMPEPVATENDLTNDLLPLLDQELSRLPEKYRSVIVLCELAGKTLKEAARQLGCAEGTISSRLTRARTMLANRLAQRGVALSSGGTLAVVLSLNAASVAAPASLVSATIKVASLFAAGQSATTAAISMKVAALTERVMKAMLLNKLMKSLMTLLLAVAGLSGAAGLIYQTQATEPPNVQPASATLPTVQAGDADKGRPPNDDLRRLEGTWRLVTSEIDGIRIGEGRPEINDTFVVFKGSSVTMAGKLIHSPNVNRELEDVKAVGTFTLDTKKKPKGIVITWETHPALSKDYFTQRGIYAVDGDSLQLCFYLPGSNTQHLVPTEFSANAGSNRTIMTFKRVPPHTATAPRLQDGTPKSDHAKGKPTKDNELLHGRRQAVEVDGRAPKQDDLRGKWTGEKNGIKVDLTFNGDKVHWQVEFRKTRKPEPPLPPGVGVNKGADLRCGADVTTGCLNFYLPKYLGDKKEIKDNPSYNGIRPVGQLRRGDGGTIQLRIIPTAYENLDQADFDYPAVQGLILRRVDEEKQLAPQGDENHKNDNP